MAASAPLARALQRLRNLRVVVVGDVLLDTYVFGETVRVSREAPVLVVRKEGEEHRPGGAANTALNLMALGAQVALVGACGHDPAGEILRSLLQQAGADVSGLISTGRSTSVKTRILAGASGTHRQQVLRLDAETELPAGGVWIQALHAALQQGIAEADAILISDYGQGALVPSIRTQALQAGPPVFVDSRYHLRDYRGMKAIAPNRPEAEAFLGRALRTPDDIAAGGEEMRAALDAELCLLTLGQDGMALFRRDAQPETMGIIGPREVTDVTGAGDTVLAAFALSVVAGIGEINAMRLATAAAGVVVGKRGTAVATPEEIEAFAPELELEPWDAS